MDGNQTRSATDRILAMSGGRGSSSQPDFSVIGYAIYQIFRQYPPGFSNDSTSCGGKRNETMGESEWGVLESLHARSFSE